MNSFNLGLHFFTKPKKKLIAGREKPTGKKWHRDKELGPGRPRPEVDPTGR
jgi:hypothetical protein